MIGTVRLNYNCTSVCKYGVARLGRSLRACAKPLVLRQDIKDDFGIKVDGFRSCFLYDSADRMNDDDF